MSPRLLLPQVTSSTDEVIIGLKRMHYVSNDRSISLVIIINFQQIPKNAQDRLAISR